MRIYVQDAFCKKIYDNTFIYCAEHNAILHFEDTRTRVPWKYLAPKLRLMPGFIFRIPFAPQSPIL